MEKEKKSIPKIILHVLEYILLAFIIFLIVFVALKACEKDVKALSDTSTSTTIESTIDLNYLSSNSKGVIMIFNPFDNSLYTSGSNSAYLFASYSNDINLTCNNYGNNIYNFYGELFSFFSSPSYTINVNENTSVCVIIQYDSYNNLYDINFIVFKLDINNEISLYNVMAQTTISSYGNNNIINFSYNLKLWNKTSYYSIGDFDTTNDYSDVIKAVYTTNYSFITEKYREEHLFGDVVSSFLNIQFGVFTIGNTTYSLTLGMLLLFIIGLGALFIIIKVFLGG